MDLDSKISFFAGYVFTAVSSISILGIVQAALIGFFGGFFGLLGKELYYSLKDKIKNEKDK